MLLNINAGNNSFPQLSCLQKVKLCYWVEGKGLYKGPRGEFLTLSLGWQVLSGSSGSFYHLQHIPAWCISSYQQCCLEGGLPVIPAGHTLVHFAEPSGRMEMVILNETEINAPRRYHGCLWALRLQLVQHNLSSLHTWWVRYTLDTSSFDLLICSCWAALLPTVDIASADLNGERKV